MKLFKNRYKTSKKLSLPNLLIICAFSISFLLYKIKTGLICQLIKLILNKIVYLTKKEELCIFIFMRRSAIVFRQSNLYKK
jgi:hypothetical protein